MKVTKILSEFYYQGNSSDLSDTYRKNLSKFWQSFKFGKVETKTSTNPTNYSVIQQGKDSGIYKIEVQFMDKNTYDTDLDKISFEKTYLRDQYSDQNIYKTFDIDVDFKNWKNVIDSINNLYKEVTN